MTRRIIPSYFVVAIDYGRRGIEAVVDPEITRQGVIDRLASGEYQNVAFIQFVADGLADDVTDDLVDAAEQQAREMEAV